MTGTYRPTARIFGVGWLLLVVGIAVLGQVVRLGAGLASNAYGAAAWYVSYLLFVAAVIWWARTQRTVVSSDGIRVKRGLSWRTLTWDEVESIPEPSRWSATQMLSVTTTTGERVRLDVPDALWQPFVAYAKAHRPSTSTDGGPGQAPSHSE
jgi:hypothetical protein